MLSFSDKEEVLKFISDNNIRILNLCHIPEDGRLRTLSFSAANDEKVADILDFGERADGSSLFQSIAPGNSDIYLEPKIQRAFINPFAVLPTLNLMCDYLNEKGEPLEIAPTNVLRKAEKILESSQGTVIKSLAELEFYIISSQQTQPLFPSEPDKNYHASSPFAYYEAVRNEILAVLDTMGIQTKYGHAEVGHIVSENGVIMEQHEIELDLQTLSQTAETIALVKWVIRNVCLRHDVSVSFIPKIDLVHAGTGMHLHLCVTKRGKNITSGPDMTLSREALAIIGGILKLAPSLSAFGNPTPISYLRFVARKESPLHICWSARNRLALIRIPLWWNFKKASYSKDSGKTFEYRAPDALANPHMILAGLVAAAEYGMSNSEEMINLAKDLQVDRARETSRRLQDLPRSCAESAMNLKKQRHFYEANGLFPREVIDSVIGKLEAYDDKNLEKSLASKPEMLEALVTKYLHYG